MVKTERNCKQPVKRRMTVLAPVTARKKAIGWAERFRTTDGGTNKAY